MNRLWWTHPESCTQSAKARLEDLLHIVIIIITIEQLLVKCRAAFHRFTSRKSLEQSFVRDCLGVVCLASASMQEEDDGAKLGIRVPERKPLSER